ncbi:hypothetical protein NMG60_11021315 [Bertholletia excelsa]
MKHFKVTPVLVSIMAFAVFHEFVCATLLVIHFSHRHSRIQPVTPCLTSPLLRISSKTNTHMLEPKWGLGLSHGTIRARENLAVGSDDFLVLDALKLWVEEKPRCDYPNACVGGQQCCFTLEPFWKDTTQIGCALVKCTNNPWWVITCNYYLRGNYIGIPPYFFIFVL